MPEGKPRGAVICISRQADKAAEQSTDRLSTYVVEGDRHFISDLFGTPERDSVYFETVKSFVETRVLEQTGTRGK